MKIQKCLIIFSVMFLSALFANDQSGKDITSIDQRKAPIEDADEGEPNNLKNDKIDSLALENNSFSLLCDAVYGECPCGHPTVTPDVECTAPGCPYSKRED